MMISRCLLASLVLGVALCACQGGTEPVPIEPADIVIVAGDAQQGTVDETLSTPLRVRALSATGLGVAGVQIQWSTDAGTVTSAGITDADGYASAIWRLGTTVGSQSASASLIGVGNRVFTASAGPGAAASIHIDTLLFMLSAGSTRQRSALARDRFGNALPPATIAWRTTDGAIAGVNASGLVTAIARGQTGVIVTAGTAADTAYLKVDEIAWISIAAGHFHTCGVSLNHVLRCWGYNAGGQLGDGGTTDRSTPATVSGTRTYTAASASWDNTCAIDDSGSIYCWGANPYGNWNSTAGPRLLLPTRLESSLRFSALSIEIWHGCALASNGAASCWGNRVGGRLGDGTDNYLSYAPVPTPVLGDGRFTQLSAGNATCAITAGGVSYCWGSMATRDPALSPTVAAGFPSFVAVSMNNQHGCGLDSAGLGYCWGNNATARLGDGTLQDHREPTRIASTRAYVEIQTGEQYSCGRTSAGALDCWGYVPSTHQPGTAPATTFLTPTAVPTSEPINGVSTNTYHFCVVTRQGNAFCQGNNFYGQLGDGTTTSHATLMRVIEPQ